MLSCMATPDRWRALELVARVDWRDPPAKGERVRVKIDADHAHVFVDDPGGARLDA